MRYALNENNEKIEVSFSGEIAYCEICKSQLKGRKGEQRIKHWYHYKRKTIDCDNWYENISDWHLKWQDLFPKENREVVMTRNHVSHRADILLNNGKIIELQNSNIKPSEIEKREKFYTKENNLIWIINGNTLVSKSFLIEEKFSHVQELKIIIPKSINSIENYNFKEIVNKVIKHPEISKLNNQNSIFNLINENTLVFKIQKENFIENFYLIEVQFKYYIACCFEYFYGQKELEYFRSEIKIKLSNIHFEVIEKKLIKKYWRKFIDKIEQPLYIDNLYGIKSDELFDYHNNMVIKKKILMNELLK